jgi:hypothetical protein
MSEVSVLTTLEEQVGLYRRLAKLAELQHEHVQQGRIEELLDVLGKRQEVVNKLSRLQVSDEVKTDPQAQALILEGQELLREITAADKRDAMVLQQRKLNLSQQINQNRSAKQVNRNYATAAYGKARGGNMDVKSS